MDNTLKGGLITFAENAYLKFIKTRYGLVHSKQPIDFISLEEMLFIYKSQIELQESQQALANSCNIDKVKEYINSK